MPSTQNQFRRVRNAVLLNFLVFGVTLTIIGATLPRIIREFNWSYTAAGAVLAFGSVGFFVSTFFSGMLIERLGPKRMMILGLLVQATGLSLFAAWPSVALNLALNFLTGLGQGGIEIASNYSVVRIERDGGSRLMNLMHGAFSVGAVVGPLLMAWLLVVAQYWQLSFRALAALSLLMAGVFATVSFEGVSRGRQEQARDTIRTRQLLRQPLLLLYFVIMFVYVGSEMGVSAWVAEYYVKILGASESLGAFMVSVFWAGLMVGRLGVSFWYHGQRHDQLLLLMAVMCSAALLAAISAGGQWNAGMGFFLTGLGFSAMYPVVLVLVGKHFRNAQAVAIGVAATGGGVGAFTFPFVMAAIADSFGIRNGFYFYVGLNVLLVLLSLAALRQARIHHERHAHLAHTDQPEDADAGRH